MKRLLIIVGIFLLSASCSKDYNDVSYYKPVDGVSIVVDSTKWEKVMISTSEEGVVYIASKEGIKKVSILNKLDTFLFCLLVMVVVFFIWMTAVQD